MREGKPSLAIPIIKDVLRADTQDSYAHYLLGIARMKCGRFLLAKQAFETANQLLPRHSENLRSLGWVKVMLGAVEEGRNDLREAISLDLMNHLPYIDLAMSYFHYFDFVQGREWLERGAALASKDPFVLHNLAMAKKMEKEYSRYSTREMGKLKEEKMNPEMQKAFRVSILEKYSIGKPLTRDEAEELREEARLNGLSTMMIKDKEQKEIIGATHKSRLARTEEIAKKRKTIEKKLTAMLQETKNDFGLNNIKNIIYNEKGQDDLTGIIAMFDIGQRAVELENVLDLINDAWNYFPHKSLNGLSPAEKLLEYQQKQNPY